MIPLRDSNPRATFPLVNYGLIFANLVAYVWLQGAIAGGARTAVQDWGIVPARLAHAPDLEIIRVFTSMFLHDPSSLGHIGGNLLFLWIFGDNVEDALGHGKYLAFYLVGGVAAAGAQVLTDPTSVVPMIGASGAIGAVLGGYLVLYPRAPITVLNPILPLWLFMGVVFVFPAWLVVGEWFVWNLIAGVGSLGAKGLGGVAFFAHIGGFLAGVLLIRPMGGAAGRRPLDPWRGWRPPPSGGAGGGRPPGRRARRPRDLFHAVAHDGGGSARASAFPRRA